MFENMDGKQFADVSGEMGQDFLRTGFQRGSAFADLNNDGFLDLVVTSLNEKPRILLNSGGQWQPLAAGGPDRPQEQPRRDRREGEGDHAVGPHALQPRDRVGRLHVLERSARAFRPGPETSAASIEIRWPSGASRRSRTPPPIRF